MKHAMILQMPSLDSVLGDRVIAPRETIEGWAFFELPESISTKQPLRIYVKDFGGAEMIQEIPTSTESFSQGVGIKPIGSVDRTGFALRYYSEASR
jgi:hypothetical protein